MIKLKNHFKRSGSAADTDEDKELAGFCRALGARVGAERGRRGLTISEISERLGLSPTYVTLLERGERMPSIRVFLRICAMFGIEPNELLELREGEKMPEGRLCKHYGLVCAVLDTFSDSELEVVAELLRTFRKLCSKT